MPLGLSAGPTLHGSSQFNAGHVSGGMYWIQTVCWLYITWLIYNHYWLWPPSAHPWYAAHPYSWLSAHPCASSTSYTTYPSVYYTIYTTIGYGHCPPTHGMPPMVCRPSIVPIVCSPSIFMALASPIFHIPLILVHTTQHMPLLAMGTVGPAIVCRQWYAAQPSCSWYAANGLHLS
jgi:hypothetical protein